MGSPGEASGTPWSQHLRITPGRGWEGRGHLACRIPAPAGGPGVKRAPAASCCKVGTAGASPASQAAGHCRKGPPRQRGTLAGLSGLPVARDKEDRWALPPSASITCGIWGKKQVQSRTHSNGEWGGGCQRLVGAVGACGSKGTNLQL